MSKPEAFTLRHSGLVNVLITEAIVHPGFNPAVVTNQPPGIKYRAIWDTGATSTVVTKKVASECNLQPVSMTKVHTVGGEIDCNVYFINIRLRNGVGIQMVRVSECATLGGDADVLIGMDLITIGDFAVTNKGGKTVFSFRTPSMEHTDYTIQPAIEGRPRVPRNAPCPCKSGKKFKRCCGRGP